MSIPAKIMFGIAAILICNLAILRIMEPHQVINTPYSFIVAFAASLLISLAALESANIRMGVQNPGRVIGVFGSFWIFLILDVGLHLHNMHEDPSPQETVVVLVLLLFPLMILFPFWLRAVKAANLVRAEKKAHLHKRKSNPEYLASPTEASDAADLYLKQFSSSDSKTVDLCVKVGPFSKAKLHEIQHEVDVNFDYFRSNTSDKQNMLHIYLKPTPTTRSAMLKIAQAQYKLILSANTRVEVERA